VKQHKVIRLYNFNRVIVIMNNDKTVITSTNINDFFKNAMDDPSLLSTVDIDHLLNSLENTKNDYLDDKNLNQLSDEIYQILETLHIPTEKQREYFSKLAGYRYVDEIHELHKGKHVRWVNRNNNGKLTNGGIIVDIKFLDTGIQVLCMNSSRRFIQYKYDECLTFQKLLLEEQLILMAYEHTRNEST
jgi:transcriptional accessory protein Tex/SPT6